MAAAQASVRPPPPAAWSGRFGEPVAERVKRYTASVDFDRRLAGVDIAGSLAHARMLAAVGVLAAADLAAIERGMATIRGEIERGEFAWSRDLEDVHFNIEQRLTALVGDAGKRLHTARSRNDQVATDLRLWLRGEIDALRGAARGRCAARCSTSPSATPTRSCRASRTCRSRSRSLSATTCSPTTRCSRATSSAGRLPPPRQPAAARQRRARRHELPDRPRARRARAGLRRRCAPNSLDAVSDRDFAIEFAAAATLVMLHLSRFAEELILWASPRFGFVRARRPLLHRQLDHAAEEESRRPRARPRQDGPRRRPPDGRCSR